MQAISRIKKREIVTPEKFRGEYRGCCIEVERDPFCQRGGFYIYVLSPEGGVLYDGWWGDFGKDINQAVEEAMTGSQLIGNRKDEV